MNPLALLHEGISVSLIRIPVSRKDYFGFRKRIALDAEGRECETGLMTDDGRHILKNGSTAELYLDADGEVVTEENSGLVSICEPAPFSTSSSSAHELLNHKLKSAMLLDETTLPTSLRQRLESGAILRIEADKPTFLLKGQDGFFLLTMAPDHADFIPPEQVMVLDESDDNGEFELHHDWEAD